MTKLQTFFRAVVMLATLGIVAKAWHLYGPSVEEMESIGRRVVEVADGLMSKYRQGGSTSGKMANDPRIGSAPPVATTLSQAPVAQPQPVLLAAAESDRPEYAQPAVASVPVEGAPPVPPTRLIPVAPEQSPSDGLPSDARQEAAGARLRALGVGEYHVEPWGGDGRWYRCSCDAPWAGASNYSRHFEAVAADPASAAEQVAAEVDQWRQTQTAAAATPRQTSLIPGAGP